MFRRHFFLITAIVVVALMAVAAGYQIGDSARETLRRIKYNVQIHRAGKEMEPLGD